MPLEAIKNLRDIGTDDTRPQLFLCERAGEQERWVLKKERILAIMAEVRQILGAAG